jgi:hypothetical protein
MYFAKVEPTIDAFKFLVSQVIRADQNYINTQVGNWQLCDYNTYGNVHYAPSPPAEPNTPDGGTPIRANFPGAGYTFDTRYTVGEYVGVFYKPQPFPSWILNTSTFLWEAPVPMPTEPLPEGEIYQWNEATQSWIIVVVGV